MPMDKGGGGGTASALLPYAKLPRRVLASLSRPLSFSLTLNYHNLVPPGRNVIFGLCTFYVRDRFFYSSRRIRGENGQLRMPFSLPGRGGKTGLRSLARGSPNHPPGTTQVALSTLFPARASGWNGPRSSSRSATPKVIPLTYIRPDTRFSRPVTFLCIAVENKSSCTLTCNDQPNVL